MRIRVAARGSELSKKQVSMFIKDLEKVVPNLEWEFVEVKTTGDKFLKPFEELVKDGYKGVFEKEVNLAVLNGIADVAVHSLKDLPTDIHPELTIAYYSKRDPPFDILISRDGKDLWELPRGAVVGTSSARRRNLLKSLRSDLTIKPLRGNVDTRLKKLERGEYDAIVLSETSIVRLGIGVKYYRLDWRLFPPAPGQGIIVAVTKRDNTEVLRLLQKISDKKSEIMAKVEKDVSKAFGGGCTVPLGAISFIEGDSIRVRATAFNWEGAVRVDVELVGDQRVGERAGMLLRKALS